MQRLHSTTFYLRVLLLAIAMMFSQISAANKVCYVGQNFDVYFDNTYWLEAIVLATDGNRCYVHYVALYDWSDQWVGSDVIRYIDFSKDLAIGTRLLVLQNGVWYYATVVKSRGADYYVNYDGWTSYWNEWVGRDRIKFLD